MKDYVKSKYLEFSKYAGSQHIAGEFAILKIVELVTIFKSSSILEIGLGIGTLPSAILTYFDRHIDYVGTEANEFCLESLVKNLKPEIYKQISIYDAVSSIKEVSKPFDLVIVDGGFDSFDELSKKLSKNAIITIEGDRKDQEDVIRKLFPSSRFVHLVSDLKNDPEGVFKSADWQGGVKVFFINPTAKQYVYWFVQKLKSKRVYSKRRKYKK